MTALAAGVLFVAASAAGWMILALALTDVVRQRQRLRNWRPDPPREGDLP